MKPRTELCTLSAIWASRRTQALKELMKTAWQIHIQQPLAAEVRTSSTHPRHQGWHWQYAGNMDAQGQTFLFSSTVSLKGSFPLQNLHSTDTRCIF
jgi:hypothetical protein